MSEFLFLMLDGEVIRYWSEDQQRTAVARMDAFTAPLKAAGRWKDGGGVGPDFDGARVRVSGGSTTVVEGPFDGAHQVVGGFMVVECESRDAAIKLAKQCPAAEWAPLEVRQLWRR
ncbi:MAG TPA: YciI family protein [Caulobacteraceae bacterium]|jgi:hypothetical protein